DRIWDGAPDAINVPVWFATDLTAGVHTVTIENVGYKRATSSATWVAFQAMIEGGPTAYDTTDPNWIFTRIASLAVAPTNEISYIVTPTGAGSGEWVGHTGSLKMQAIPTWT